MNRSPLGMCDTLMRIAPLAFHVRVKSRSQAMSAPAPHTCPLSPKQVIDRYFLEHRQKVLDVAAFLDRIDRAAPDASPDDHDHRLQALRDAIDVLRDGQPHRARRVLETLSDPTDTPAPNAKALGPASGAPQRPR